MTVHKQSRSYNQHQLKVICDKLCDNIEELFDFLALTDIKQNGKMMVGKCPIHDGDNNTAFNIYPEGESYRGNWKCRTHNCEKIFKSSIIGFIRGVLSNKKYNWSKSGDQTVSFQETIEFVESFLDHKVEDIKISKSEIEKTKFANIVNHIIKPAENITNKVKRSQVRKMLEMPCHYFLSRGYLQETLDKYDVGLCNNKQKEMFQRAVVPIYDNDYKYLVGCTGRSIWEKCCSCGSYHDPNIICPGNSDKWKYCKWKHNHDFKSQNHLYNFWFAKKYILESTQVILVESPGNVWRLEEAGIHNSVAMFGSSLSDRQKIILDGSGAMNIVILTDNDEAGEKASKVIIDKCKNTYKVSKINFSKPDIGEMTIDEINKEIKPQLEKII